MEVRVMASPQEETPTFSSLMTESNPFNEREPSRWVEENTKILPRHYLGDNMSRKQESHYLMENRSYCSISGFTL